MHENILKTTYNCVKINASAKELPQTDFPIFCQTIENLYFLKI